MPTLFFVRDGSGDCRTSKGRSLAMSAAAGLATKYPLQFTQSGPNINEGVASLYSTYRHVVMEVTADDATMEYPRAGVFYFVNFCPQ